MRKLIKRLIAKIRYERFCKLNNHFCPDCIYHKFIFEDGIVFRGNDCQHPYWKRGEENECDV